MTEVSRRDFLKALIPGAWIGELRNGGGVGSLSTAAKVGLIKDVFLLTGGGVMVILSKETQSKTFKERVLSLRWDQLGSKELEAFSSDLADEYLRLTKTPRVNKTDLVGEGKTNFFGSRTEMVEAVRKVDPNFSPSTSTQWGYTDFKSGKVFIDLASLKEQTSVQAKKNNLDPNKTAGVALLDALWHEWGHIDVVERTQGELFNNPKYFFRSPVSNKEEPFRKYRGVEVFTDTYYGFLRFEEVVNEAITVRRMIEQVGLESAFSAADYYQNGIDFFPRFTSAAGIKLDDLYQMHAISDFEGIVRLIGSKLPGGEEPFAKGIRLAVGIHQSDPQLIQQTGVYSILPRNR